MIEDPLRFHVRPALRDPALLIALRGWNDAEEAATTAVRFVANALDVAPLAEIDPEEYADFSACRPSVVIDDGEARGLEWPATRFGFAAARPSGGLAGRDLVTCHGVEPSLRWRDWAGRVVSLVDALGIQRILLFGAFLDNVLYSRPVELKGFASDPALLRELAVAPARYKGRTGMIGVLAQLLRDHGCQVAALWAGLPHYIDLTPNTRGSLALLERGLPFLGLDLDLEPLRQAARECEKNGSEMVTGDPELAEYVRELKRREFVQ